VIISAPGGNAISWNIVHKHVSPGVTVKEKLTRRIAHLARHLVHFPPETLHLQVVLEKLEKKGTYTVRLTLRLPSNILHAEKSDADLLHAIDTATRALEREVESLKADLRGDYRWKRPAYRARLRSEQTLVFAEPMAEGTGPQTNADIVAELLAAHTPQLLAHVRRELRMAELTGEIPRAWVEASDVVDEAARRCLKHPEKKPAGLTYEHWFYRLISEELARVRRQCADERAARGEPPLPERAPPGLEDEAQGYDAEQPLDLIAREFEPAEALPEDRIPDSTEPSPDAAVAGRDLVETLQQQIKQWPPHERDIFELHYLSGFEPGDIAMIRGLKSEQVAAFLTKIQLRLRDFLRLAAA
jgi:ribosomal subunit interface protein